MRRSMAAALVVSGLLVPGGSIALADPNLPDVPRHRHFIVTPNDQLVEVGPRVCDDSSLQRAFNQYHNNLHRSFGVPSDEVRGPRNGAPGLTNERGAELIARGCSFRP